MGNGIKCILSVLLMLGTLILGAGAQAQQSSAPVMPWGMTWETTPEEYLDAFERHFPGTAYSIRETLPREGKGQYYIEHEVVEGSRLLQYRAIFLGEPTGMDNAERQLEDVASNGLRFFDLTFSDAPPPGETWDIQKLYTGDVLREFEMLSRPFGEAFGLDTAYSYIRVGASGEGEEYFKLSIVDGNVDFAPIERHFAEAVQAEEAYWLVLGNGHASLRLYVATLSDPNEDPRTIWHNTYYFSEEAQKQTPRGAGVLS